MLSKTCITHLVVIVLMVINKSIFGFSISKTPVCEVFTPKSLYPEKKYPESFVGDRKRVSTCGGVAWFHDNNYLATINFEGGFIRTYNFNKAENQCTHLQTIYATTSAPLSSAENIAFSGDGTLVAVSLNHKRCVNVYRVSTETHLIDPTPVAIVKHKERCVHGVRFSHQKQYLACTTVRGANLVTFYKVEEDRSKRLRFTITSQLEDHFLPLKPKSLDFSKDDEYVVVVYAANVVKVPNKVSGLIAVYKFDKNTGIIDQIPTATYMDSEFKGGEDINFSCDDSHVVISEHASDRIIVHPFNKKNGTIGPKIFELNNPDAKLSFPHGINLSSDGRYLAVAHYGDDKFSIYAVH